MYLTSPISDTLRFTSSVSATGEKTARPPDSRRTVEIVSEWPVMAGKAATYRLFPFRQS